LAQQGVRAFDIATSCGMSGWVLAQAVHHQVLNDAAEPSAHQPKP
jgi:hypothetical protein